jgi:hypothetical protein
METHDSNQQVGHQIGIALAEYSEIRSEISRRSQAQSALLAFALTATTAVGTYGFGSTDRREALLVLPLVLSGLALLYLHYAVLSRTVANYVRTELWPFLQEASRTGNDAPLVPSGEAWAARDRQRRGRLSPAGLVTFLGQGVVFGIPAVGALVATRPLAWGHAAAPIWWLGLLAVLGAICMVVIIDVRELSPRDLEAPRTTSDEPSP